MYYMSKLYDKRHQNIYMMKMQQTLFGSMRLCNKYFATLVT